MQGRIRSIVFAYIKNNMAKLFFVTLLLMLGIAVGTMAVRTLTETARSELSGCLMGMFQQLDSLESVNSTQIMQGMCCQLKSLLLIWLLGFTIIGIPFIMFIVFAKGFVIGFTVGIILEQYLVKGLAFVIAGVLPHNLLTMPMLVVGAVTAIDFSVYIIRRRKELPQKLWAAAMNYTIIFLAAGLLTCAGVAAEGMLLPTLSRLVIMLMNGG